MNQKDLQKQNDMLAKISALKASIDALKITDGKEYKELLVSNEKILVTVEAEYKKFTEDIKNKQKLEVKRKQEEGQKLLKDEITFLNKYFAYISKLKHGDHPSEEMLSQFNRMKRKPHILRQLRNMMLKSL